jgi:hypothetical protein
MDAPDFELMFHNMLGYLREIAITIVPDMEKTDMFITGTQNKREMTINFNMVRQEHVGLFLGRNKRNLDMIIAWLRAQQICPGDRHIIITVSNEEGRTQRFKDSKLFKRENEKVNKGLEEKPDCDG